MSDLLITTAVAVVMVVALAGVVIPVLPGLVLIWVAALAYGFSVGFGATGAATMAILTILLVASLVAGVILPRRSAVDSGAAPRSQFVGMVGAVVGFFVIPVVGLIVGALVGVLLAEYGDKGSWPEARTATIGLAKGFGINAAVQLGLGFVMIAIWSLWAATVLF